MKRNPLLELKMKTEQVVMTEHLPSPEEMQKGKEFLENMTGKKMDKFYPTNTLIERKISEKDIFFNDDEYEFYSFKPDAEVIQINQKGVSDYPIEMDNPKISVDNNMLKEFMSKVDSVQIKGNNTHTHSNSGTSNNVNLEKKIAEQNELIKTMMVEMKQLKALVSSNLNDIINERAKNKFINYVNEYKVKLKKDIIKEMIDKKRA